MPTSSFLGSPLFLPPSSTSTSTSTNSRHAAIQMSLSPNPIANLAKLLWGPSLPPNLLISSARSAWSAAWNLMMSQIAPSDPSTGAYSRPASQFRRPSPHSPPPTDLHLYVGLPCPWAHRTLIVRALKGLESSVPVSIAAPGEDGSWQFKESNTSAPENENSNPYYLVPGPDKANRCKTLKEIYNLRLGGYRGRSTVPMLWDCNRREVFCNESYDIIQIFNSEMNELSSNPGLDLSPPHLKDRINEWNRIIYPNVNNGVYRCGFAQSQEAYDVAANDLFATLDMVEEHLGSSRYLCGGMLTLADVCLFTTLVRFDLVYNVLFKCTKKKLIEYPNLHGYMRDIYQIPKVAATCNLGAIMDGYYKILFPLNPGSIRPAVPFACEHEMLMKPHNREFLSSSSVENGKQMLVL
ncbi:glutathione S-transferase family protein [Striga asiatica]|uniref:Glutathione S-transferase family protein n=1 Tax=Striga asiatica TaxID=4170 RepID=A0A5A7QNT5_STRAF|nr:glutathione S-transferase family protein [Striga asiatica]